VEVPADPTAAVLATLDAALARTLPALISHVNAVTAAPALLRPPPPPRASVSASAATPVRDLLDLDFAEPAAAHPAAPTTASLPTVRVRVCVCACVRAGHTLTRTCSCLCGVAWRRTGCRGCVGRTSYHAHESTRTLPLTVVAAGDGVYVYVNVCVLA
jgi:hypothetical protein